MVISPPAYLSPSGVVQVAPFGHGAAEALDALPDSGKRGIERRQAQTQVIGGLEVRIKQVFSKSIYLEPEVLDSDLG